MSGQIEGTQITDGRLTKANGLLVKPVRKVVSPLWALVASTLMAGAACALVWALLLGPQADLSHLRAGIAATEEPQVLVATEGR